MATNNSKLLGMYDELSSFLAQINVYRGKGLCDSHDLSTFLSWNRSTGNGLYYACTHFITIICIVSGDANFDMQRTALTVGGFTQPSVGRALIEFPASIEKGLTQRFLWIFPKPSFSPFNSLELIEENFSQYLGKCVEIVKVGNYLQTNAFIAS